MTNNNSPIGVFDSGLGGLTVLNELKKVLPNESFIYFGDNAHLPYGNKSAESIIDYSQQIVAFLLSHNVKCIVIACNTASAIALNQLTIKFSIPIIDVISPIVALIKNNKDLKSLGIIGTTNTIQSNSYTNRLLAINNNLNIHTKACPLFVPIIEEGMQNHKVASIITEEYLQDIIVHNLDALILACTHYPMIISTIKKHIPKKIKIIDSAKITANYVKNQLSGNDLLSNTIDQKLKFYVSDKPHTFYKKASEFLNINLDNLEKVTLI